LIGPGLAAESHLRHDRQMLGLMQDAPLSVESILRRGERYFPTRTVVTRTADAIERTTFAGIAVDARRVAGALRSLGVGADARVGSFAWNTARHLALYFGVPASGRVLHTINIRYFPDQIVYSVNHAEDEVIFVDRSLLPLFARIIDSIPTVRHIIVMDDGAAVEIPADPRIALWSEVVDTSDEFDFTDLVHDENTAAALCYTTGTTGNPKGVLYSHRSIWLHAAAGTSTSSLGITDHDNVLPVVPMFHAMAWGLPYTTMMAGGSLVMPGPDLSPGGLLNLMESERVTMASGVPTIWMGMLPLLAGRDLSALTKVMAGGSAVPRSLSEGWRNAIGLPITQGWGMTETSPVGALSILRAELIDAPIDDQADALATGGLALIGIDMRIIDTESGAELPWDGQASGELEVRGPWVARQYYRTDEPGEQFTADGWLRTGDVATISPLGYTRLVDRTKDLVKSGGEWISSVDLENQIMGHPDVAEAAVIAAAHPRWMERPLACVVVKPGHALDRDQLLEFLRERLTSWQVPDDVIFLDEIPKTSVGKFSKKTLREKYGNHLVENDS
jgi:fatty-acyl-CoA synthase